MSLTAALAQENGASVCLFYVSGAPIDPSKPEPYWQRELMFKLQRIGLRWFEGKVPYDPVVWSGDAAAAIVRAAQEMNADLIIMATRCRGIDRLLLGSVTARVVRESPVKALTVRPKPI